METQGRYAIYSRKSRFTGKGESITNQITICRRTLLTRFGAKEEDIVVFEDEGFSGANTRRPQFLEMMQRCRAREFRLVICYRLDRISRNTADFLNTYEELCRCGVGFHSVSDGLDGTTAMGRAMMMISSVFAQLERDIIAERISDNMLELAKTGRWLGGNTPTGYQSRETEGSVTAQGRVRKAHMLELIPEEAGLVREIFHLFLALRSLTACERELINSCKRTKQGRLFSRYAIKNILTNPVYMINDKQAYQWLTDSAVQLFSKEEDFDGAHGIIAYNKTMHRQGKALLRRDKSHWIAAVGKHRGIISGGDWAQVQAILESSSRSPRRSRAPYCLLSGVLLCGRCKSYMRPKLTQRTAKSGQRRFDYLCQLKEKSRSCACSMKRINGNELDELVFESLILQAADSPLVSGELERLSHSFRFTSLEKENRDEISKALHDLAKRRQELTVSISKAGDSPAVEDIIEEINRIHRQEDQLSSAMQLKEKSSEQPTCCDLKSLLGSLGPAAKRDLIKRVVSKIEFDGEQVHIYPKTKKEPLCECCK